MIFDLPPDPPKFWLPPKPAIIRATDRKPREGVSFFVPPPFWLGDPGPPILDFTDSAAAVHGSSATYTFSNMNIGAATADRLVVAAISGRASGTNSFVYTAVTIGGSAATLHVASGSAAGITSPTCIASRVVPSGTTASIVVTSDGVIDGVGVAVYTIKNLISTTPVDSDARDALWLTLSGSVNRPADGVSIGSHANSSNGNILSAGGAMSIDFNNSPNASWRSYGASGEGAGATTDTLGSSGFGLSRTCCLVAFR